MYEQQAYRVCPIVENSRDAFFLISTNGIINYYNTSSSLHFGYSKEEMLNKHISLLFFEKGQKQIENKILKLCSGHEIESYNAYLKKKNGSKSYFSIDLGAIWDSNHKFKAISIHLRNLNFQKASKREIKYKGSTI
jgi:PAS domain S-box-containing protein